MSNGGMNALSGFIFQTLYAIMLCMEDKNWDRIKIEPITVLDKTDIILYNSKSLIENDDIYHQVDIHVLNGEHKYKKIQVKKRKDGVTVNNIKEWVNLLKKDDPADEYELCLFGNIKEDNLKLSGEYDHVVVYENDLEKTESRIWEAIKRYCGELGAQDYSEEDIYTAYSLLFLRLIRNSIQQDSIGRSEINKDLKKLMDSSVDNCAVYLKELSRQQFYANPTYIRDLSPARLDKDGQTLIKEESRRKLSQQEFPFVKRMINNTPESDNSAKLQFNLFDYIQKHVKDDSLTRHIFLSATSGSGKSTYMYGLWEKYLNDEEEFIPIYVSLKSIHSIKQYIETYFLEGFKKAKHFKWLKEKGGFSDSKYHLILLLDGYNEIAVNLSPDGDDTIKKEIEEIFEIKNITVIITSRSPKCPFDQLPLTCLKLCSLNREQIMSFTGGNNDNLPKVIYKGVLDNPFMLEICIKAFAGDKKRFKDINQVSMEEILEKYIQKQINGILLSTEDKIYIQVVLPLVAMELDKRATSLDRTEIEVINPDVKSYRTGTFPKTVREVQKRIAIYEDLFSEYVPKYDKTDYVHLITTNKNAVTLLVESGVALEIFSSDSSGSKEVTWDHEVYRDYFVARGYAIYCAFNENAEDLVYNLAKQINYRFPEPDIENLRPKVDSITRDYHLRKAQMFIDMVDARIDHHVELKRDYLDEMKNMSVYRRLTRDVALIYEELDLIQMVKYADLSIRHYSDQIQMYKHASKYDYEDIDRRYADAAYSYSSLGYNFVHNIIPTEEKEYYLDQALIAFNHAESIFESLEKAGSKVLNNLTVWDDRLKLQGNRAAYYIACGKMSKNEKEKKKLFRKALKLHKTNLKERKEIKKIIIEKGEDTTSIDNGIAQTYNGIGTVYFWLGQYRDSIKTHCKALKIRPEEKRLERFTSFRNIIGGYAAMKDCSEEDVVKALNYIVTAYKYANDNRIYRNYNDLEHKTSDFMRKLVKEQEANHRDMLDRIKKERKTLAEKSFNSVIQI